MKNCAIQRNIKKIYTQAHFDAEIFYEFLTNPIPGEVLDNARKIGPALIKYDEALNNSMQMLRLRTSSKDLSEFEDDDAQMMKSSRLQNWLYQYRDRRNRHWFHQVPDLEAYVYKKPGAPTDKDLLNKEVENGFDLLRALYLPYLYSVAAFNLAIRMPYEKGHATAENAAKALRPTRVGTEKEYSKLPFTTSYGPIFPYQFLGKHFPEKTLARANVYLRSLSFFDENENIPIPSKDMSRDAILHLINMPEYKGKLRLKYHPHTTERAIVEGQSGKAQWAPLHSDGLNISAEKRAQNPVLDEIATRLQKNNSIELPPFRAQSKAQGLAEGGSVSASTAMNIFQVKALKKEIDSTISVELWAFVVLTFMAFDGGHRLHECMAVYDSIEKFPITDGMDQATTDMIYENRKKFIQTYQMDYDHLADLLENHKEFVMQLLNRATNTVIDIFDNISPYSKIPVPLKMLNLKKEIVDLEESITDQDPGKNKDEQQPALLEKRKEYIEMLQMRHKGIKNRVTFWQEQVNSDSSLRSGRRLFEMRETLWEIEYELLKLHLQQLKTLSEQMEQYLGNPQRLDELQTEFAGVRTMLVDGVEVLHVLKTEQLKHGMDLLARLTAEEKTGSQGLASEYVALTKEYERHRLLPQKQLDFSASLMQVNTAIMKWEDVPDSSLEKRLGDLWQAQERGHQNTSLIELAQLARAIYHVYDLNYIPEGWEIYSSPSDPDDENNYRGQAYRNVLSGEIVIAFCSTGPVEALPTKDSLAADKATERAATNYAVKVVNDLRERLGNDASLPPIVALDI